MNPGDVRVPDVVGEILGWRAWRLAGSLRRPRLVSATAVSLMLDESVWPTNRWFEGKCPHGHTTDVPVENCTCGIYAARDRDHLVQLGYGVYTSSDKRVIGEVAFAGKVIPGTQGWRAQKARIVRLIVPYEYWKWADPLGAAYKVPVEVGFLFADRERRRR